MVLQVSHFVSSFRRGTQSQKARTGQNHVFEVGIQLAESSFAQEALLLAEHYDVGVKRLFNRW